ncbi:MAG: LpqB family beta-propeller domain-containing protein, partial [Gammaproteobacteria bacterium]
YSGLYVVDAHSGETKPLVRERTATYRGLEGAWSGDGTAVFYPRDDPQQGIQLRARHLETGTERELYRAEAGARIHQLALSSDGRNLAFVVRNGTDSTETLVVMPAEGGESRRLATVRNGEVKCVEWTRDGSELLFLTPGKPPSVWHVPFEGGTPKKLDSALDGFSTFRLHPDGRRLALVRGEMRSEVWVIDRAVPVSGARRANQ